MNTTNGSKPKKQGKRLLDFYAEWCQPCKMQGPVIDELKKEGFNVKKVDIDTEEELTSKYGVMSIPTMIVVENGKEIKRFMGVQSKATLVEALR